MDKKLKKHFGLRLEECQIKQLERIADKEKRSVASVIRLMIDDGIKKYKKK